MYANICDPEDSEAIARFKEVLSNIGADLGGKSWAIGVDVFEFSVGNEHLTVFSDAWSVDIKGPDSLVLQILGLLNSQP